MKDIVDDPVDFAMVKSINEIGHLMGMQTIAEFVENDQLPAEAPADWCGRRAGLWYRSA